MADIVIDKLDESKMILHCEKSILTHMWEFFSFFAKDYKHMPKFKAGMWDGKIRMISRQTHEMSIGLIHEVIRYALDFEYTLDIDPDIHLARNSDPCPVDIDGLIDSFNLEFEPYDYQVNAIEDIFRHHKRFLLSPTSSGKSFIIYGAMRQLVNDGKQVLIVCPTTTLVDQMVGDFDDYSQNNDFKAYDTCHRIYSGKEKNNRAPVTVSTWQSIFRKGPKWFEGFDAVFVDEAHLATGASLTGIMDKCVNAAYRIGLTGTINDAKVHKMSLIALFGRVTETITTRELIDRGIVSQLRIRPIVFEHNAQQCAAVSKLPYQDEIDMICGHTKVNKFICNLALTREHNTLILFRLVEKQGKPLFQILTDLNTRNKPIYYIDGDTPTDERRRIQKLAETRNDMVIVASYGTFSTGISIKNLHNIVLAHPLKGKITLLQSIGRVLRKSAIHDVATVYDIACNFTHGAKVNTTFKHFKDRLKQYVKSKFDVKLTKVTI